MESKMADVTATLAERGTRYGDFTDHAELAQELQRTMQGFRRPGPDGTIVHPWPKLDSVKRQALTVIADKIARIISGDPEYTDNWHDIQGYAKLAEDRCVDASAPQLPFPPVSDGRTLDTFGSDDTLIDTDALAGQHAAVREGDEYVCRRCHKRWGTDEDAPETCA